MPHNGVRDVENPSQPQGNDLGLILCKMRDLPVQGLAEFRPVEVANKSFPASIGMYCVLRQSKPPTGLIVSSCIWPPKSGADCVRNMSNMFHDT